MRRMMVVALAGLALLGGVTAVPARAGDATEAELLQAATDLGRQYDTNYNTKNAAGMAGLYMPDGVMISPGPVLRGTAELQAYYASRFTAGATGHATKIVEVHVQGDGGYGVGQFSVSVPDGNGGLRDLHGNLAMVYGHAADGWHFRLLAASVPPPPK